MNTIIINRKKEIKINETGLYSYKNELEPFMRIQNTNSDLEGVIRFNNNNFEGYNGTKWVLFNSVKGEKGETGDNFSNKFIFRNLSDSLEDGLLFKNNHFIKENDNDIIETRVLKSGYYNYNNINIKSIDIITDNNNIVLNPLPLPNTIQDFSNLSIDNLKSKETNNEFKSFGNIEIYKTRETIRKGCFVILDSDDCLYVKSIEYEDLNKFINPIHIIGIALEDSDNKEKIKICTKGITTVRCNIDASKINNNFINNCSIDKIGTIALVDKEGCAFVSLIEPDEYLYGGYFLETGKITVDNYLFLIRINF